MKKILLLFTLCAMLPMVAVAQELDGTFEISDLTNSSGSLYYFDVSLSGNTIYTAYNISITIPSGMSFARTAQNKLRVTMIKNGGVYPYDEELDEYPHTVSAEEPVTNFMNVACASFGNDNFVSTSGKLFRVFVTLDNATLEASFSPKPIVKLSGLNLTTKTEIAYRPADFACRPFTTGIPTSRTLPLNVSADNKVGTLILPFDADLPSGLKAYTCNAIEGDLLTLTPAASLAACTPYIVYAENGYSGSISGTVSFSGDNVTDIFANGFLTGVLTGTTVNTGYILQNQGSGPMFYDAEGVAFSLPAGRCYLTPSVTPGVKSFAFNFGDTNGINSIVHCPLSIVNCFDLQGRRVSSPTRGIYIKGTRKVIVK